MGKFFVLVPVEQGQARRCQRMDTLVRYALWSPHGSPEDALKEAKSYGRQRTGNLMGLAAVVVPDELYGAMPMTGVPKGELPETCFRVPEAVMTSFMGCVAQQVA